MSALGGTHVIFGNGPVGSAAACHLLRQGHRVRVVSRSGRRPLGLFDELPKSEQGRLQFLAADAMDPRAAAEAAQDASHVYHCINAAYQDWEKLLPTIQENLVEATLQAGAVLAVAENLYMYARGDAVISERTPERPPTRKGALRKRLHDALAEASRTRGLRWTAVRASDYYGPGATFQSVFGTRLFLGPLLDGRRPRVLGSPDLPHTVTYVGDYGRALVVAALDPCAHGQAWIVPNDRTLTTRQVAEIFFTAADRRASLGTLPRGLVTVLGVFSPLLHEVVEMLYQKEEPYVVDGTRFAGTFHFSPTPLEQGVRKTLAWYALLNRRAVEGD